MEFFHLDLESLVITAGSIGLVAIVFAESGLFFGFFLPGDSLLFTAGLLASQGYLHIWSLAIFIPLAAIFGDNVGYWFGKKVGPKIFVKSDSFFFHEKHVARSAAFFAKYGPKAIVIARFVPVVRTFVPILAGVGTMNYSIFIKYNIIGGVIWGGGFILLGYFLGEIFPQIEDYMFYVIGLIIASSFIPVCVEYMKSRSLTHREK